MKPNPHTTNSPVPDPPKNRLIAWCLENPFVIVLLGLLTCGWGVMVAPFDWDIFGLPRDTVAVDAIPDIGENQQIVFARWDGRSPQDIEDQVTYPLTVTLLGLSNVKTIRSYSMFGFTSIYVIFDEKADYYDCRSRILEKLNSLSSDMLPPEVTPVLGPDATALGQVFWYTLEGLNDQGEAVGGWDLEELRRTQDWYVRYALLSSPGVSEVASIGGFQNEYQVDVDPDAMRAFKVSLEEVFQAVRKSNSEVGAKSIEYNSVEYVIRGSGFVKSLEDIKRSVVKVVDDVPVYIENVAHVSLGPANRRGALDKEGTEAVGGVVIARAGQNPMQVITELKNKIAEISPGLPTKKLPDGQISRISIVPFYDRSIVIHETLQTLNNALVQEILITSIVVILMVGHIRSSILISIMLPISILAVFILMKFFKVDANIVALSGIVIAIGTMVDIGIILTNNILHSINIRQPDHSIRNSVLKAASEVAGPIATTVATTVLSFIPIFALEAAEGKLFRPLAFTKSFALIVSLVLSMTLLPVIASILLGIRMKFSTNYRHRAIMENSVWTISGIFLIIVSLLLPDFSIIPNLTTQLLLKSFGVAMLAAGILFLFFSILLPLHTAHINRIKPFFIAFASLIILSQSWSPLGYAYSSISQLTFVCLIVAASLGGFKLIEIFYPPTMKYVQSYAWAFMLIPVLSLGAMCLIWFGAPGLFGDEFLKSRIGQIMKKNFPGLGNEFMPSLDEGTFLYMPTTLPHASIGESMDALRIQDMLIASLPEISSVVGKIGRADTALDPAPISMVETIIEYSTEFFLDNNQSPVLFEFDASGIDFQRDMDGNELQAADGLPYFVQGKYVRDSTGKLKPDASGRPFRLWRQPLDPSINPDRASWPGIRNSNDIWESIVAVAHIPGSTSAPRLQPISARIVMLQSGMRSPIGIKVKGPSLDTIEQFGIELEQLIKHVPGVSPDTVIADRIVGKPYLDVIIDREAIARYGLSVAQIHQVMEVAIGGIPITRTVEGRERYNIRVRYQREHRDHIEALHKILIPTPQGLQIPLTQLAHIEYRRGPQNIKSEDTFLISYVLFDGKSGISESEVVQNCQDAIQRHIQSGDLTLPSGVSFEFAGNYQNQIRSEKRLLIVIPIALIFIVIILYLQFGSVTESLIACSGVVLAWGGGFILLWLFNTDWFMNFSISGIHMRELFHIQSYNLSVAVWVGFLAVAGIATDDGVMMSSILKSELTDKKFQSVSDLRSFIISSAQRRVKPCLMTSATTILALLPVLMSKGRGADVMIPMAIPCIGGMIMCLLSLLIVPMMLGSIHEFAWRRNISISSARRIALATFFILPLIYSARSARKETADVPHRSS